MKVTRRLISVILCILILVSMTTLGMTSAFAAGNPYSEAAMNLDKEYSYDGELGNFYTEAKTIFRTWAPTCTKVDLNIYATGTEEEPNAGKLGSYEMTKLNPDDWKGVWEYTLEGDYKNKFYTYSFTRNSSILGNGVEQTVESQDVYSYAVGANGDRTMICDINETDPENWDKDEHVYVDNQSDASIWEVVVKDFSYDEKSGVSEENRGKYLAFTELNTTLNNEGDIATCVNYLKDLGITHVQINPFYDFATIDETSEDTTQFNWGYDPKNYGTPEGSYSSDPYDGKIRIMECKQMIQALHDAGIGVIMDVVLNHTYSIDSCFTAAVPMYYYRLSSVGAYSAQSGCGNDTASERYMFRRYMRDILKYWVDEYHIDGYRFDIMGIHDVETMNLIRQDMDEVDKRIIMYGEGWSGSTIFDPTTCTGEPTYACSQTNASLASERIGFFSDSIRDGIKGGVFDGPTSAGFASGSKVHSPNIIYGIRANTVGKGASWHPTVPTQCVTYGSCHDNMTLYDKLAGTNYGASVDYRARYNNVIDQNKLAAAILKTCQGIDFMQAGEEMGRSKDGDDNSYKSAATLNMIDWSLLQTNADLVSYYRGLLELRSKFSPFRASTLDVDDDSFAYFVDNSGTEVTSTISFSVHNENKGEWSDIAVLYNGAKTDGQITFGKNNKYIDENTEWVIIADKSSAGITSLGTAKGLTFDIPASSAIILVEKNTFEENDIKSKYSKVIVENVSETTGKVLSKNVVLGMNGSKYNVSYDTSIPLQYEYDKAEGSTTGYFSDKDTTVKFLFKDYVPSSFLVENGDVDDSGNINIVDATTVQKYVAKMQTLDDEHIKRGDYNFDKSTNIVDVTLLQKYLAKEVVSVCTVTTNFLAEEKGELRKIADPVKQQFRLGTEYTTEGTNVTYYVLDKTPDNATGMTIGDISVDYVYKYTVDKIKIHVKHSGELDWVPYLWAWVYDDKGTAINCYDSWPGLMMKMGDDGWYDTEFAIPGKTDYGIIISKAGTPQTKDYIPLSDPEIWVVIDDPNVGKGNDWLNIYNYNPDLEN